MSPARELVRNLLFKLVPAPFEKLSRFVVVLVAAPILGASAFGTYQFAITTSLLLATVFELGLNTFTTRALARGDDAAGVVAAGLKVRLSLALPYAAVVLLVGLFAGQEERTVILLVGAATLAGSLVDYGSAVLRGLESFQREASVNVARAALLTVTALAALFFFRTLTALAKATLLGATASLVVSSWVVRDRISERPRLSRAAIAFRVRELAPLGLAAALSVLYFRCDVLLLRALTSPTEVGYYSLAYRIFEATTVVPAALSQVMFPRLARRASTSPGGTALDAPKTAWQEEERQLVVWTGALGLAAGAGLSLESERIVRLVFGGAFLPAAAPLRVLGFAAPFLFVNFGLTCVLFARSGERAYVRIVVFMLVINVATNALLIPRLGGSGAAWATLGTEAVLAACSAYAAMRSRSLSDGFSMKT